MTATTRRWGCLMPITAVGMTISVSLRKLMIHQYSIYSSGSGDAPRARRVMRLIRKHRHYVKGRDNTTRHRVIGNVTKSCCCFEPTIGVRLFQVLQHADWRLVLLRTATGPSIDGGYILLEMRMSPTMLEAWTHAASPFPFDDNSRGNSFNVTYKSKILKLWLWVALVRLLVLAMVNNMTVAF